MAKLTLPDVGNILGNPTSAQSRINSNNTLIEQALENTLSLDGTTPNQMGADIDLNGNDLLNVGVINADSIAIGGSEDLLTLIGQAEEAAEDALLYSQEATGQAGIATTKAAEAAGSATSAAVSAQAAADATGVTGDFIASRLFNPTLVSQSSPTEVRAALQGSLQSPFVGAVSGGVTDNKDRLRALLNEAASASRIGAREVVFRGNMFSSRLVGISGALDVPSNVRVINDGDFTLVPLTPGMFGFRSIGAMPGVYTALSADASVKSASISIPSTAGISIGNYVYIRSNKLLPGVPNRNAAKCAQMAKVIGKTATEIYIDALLEYDFLVADAAEVGVTNLVENATIENVRWGDYGFGTLAGRGWDVKLAANIRAISPHIENTRAIGGPDDASAGGINLQNVLGAYIQDVDFKGIGYYGVAACGPCRDVIVRGGRIFNSRHAIALPDPDEDDFGNYGEPVDCRFEDINSVNSSLSAFDTHSVGRRLIFDKCVSTGAGDCGFQIRTSETTVRDCEANFSAFDGGTVRYFTDPASVALLTSIKFENFKASRNKRCGVRAQSADIEVINPDIRNNGDSAVSGRYGVSLQGGRISGGRIIDNNFVNVIRYHEADGEVDAPLVIENLHAPASATQTAFMNMGADAAYSYRNVRVRGLRADGYTDSGRFTKAGTAGIPALATITTSQFTDEAAGNESSGIATLAGGTVTVNTTAARNFAGNVGSNSRMPLRLPISLTVITPGGAPGALRVSAIVNGTSFTITSTSGTDASTVFWAIG